MTAPTQRSETLASSPNRMALGGYGSIPPASTSPVARSYQRLSTLCIGITRSRRCVMLTSTMFLPERTLHTPAANQRPEQISGRASDTHEDGLCRSLLRPPSSYSSPTTGLKSARRRRLQTFSKPSLTSLPPSLSRALISLTTVSLSACHGQLPERRRDWRIRHTAY